MSHDDLNVNIETIDVQIIVENVPSTTVEYDPDVIVVMANNVGPQGIQGEQGIQGIQGIQGLTGTGITMQGSVALVGDLPPSGNTQGDAYIVQSDDSLHIWDGTAWFSGGSIQGPQGIQGIQGIQGDPGPTGSTGPTGPAGSSGWQTGDYKISAVAATHADPNGGTWYLCDGSATVGAPLIALVGATLPDAVGRALVMKGTHADNNAIGKSDGEATKANRRMAHKHTVVQPTISTPAITQPSISKPAITQPTISSPAVNISDPGHTHNVRSEPAAGGSGQPIVESRINTAFTDNVQALLNYTGITASLASAPIATGAVLATNPIATGAALASAPVATSGTVGPQTAGTPLDQGSFVVPGNLFVHS